MNIVGGKVKIKPNEVAIVKAEIPSDKITGYYTIRVCSESGASAAYTTILLAGEVETVTWLKGWKYRKPILIVERSGNRLVNYQVRVELTLENFDYSKARIDGGDLRFTDSDGVTLLPYWIEKWNPGGTSIIWVKIPEIPANSEKKIYLY